MSYDGWLVIDTGGDEPARVAEIGNYTVNVARMWSHALEYASFMKGGRRFERLQDTEGHYGKDVIATLEHAVDRMARNPEMYRKMEPSNGWGDYEGALAYLRRVLELCRAHPNAWLEWYC